MRGHGGVHVDELLELGAAVDDAVVWAEDKLEQLGDGPCDDCLGEGVSDRSGTGIEVAQTREYMRMRTGMAHLAPM